MNITKKSSIPREDFILIVLEVLEKFGPLSAKEIDNKLKDKECLKKLGILDHTKTKIPSYPTIRRILPFLEKEKNFVKWIPTPTKEMRYQIKREGKMYLAGRKCEGEDYAATLFNPPDCKICEKEQIEKCWEENFEWLRELIAENHLGKSLNLTDNKKTSIKALFKEPSRLAQICSYYELREEIGPFFEKHLKYFTNKIKSLCEK